MARVSKDGRVLLRLEDLDTARVVPGAAERILEDLAWLGLDADEGWGTAAGATPAVQSARIPIYERALAWLDERRFVYPCDCSRKEIETVASAPHPGEERVYPGTCRAKDRNRPMRRPPAMRVLCEGIQTIDDRICGPFTQDLATDVGDFVVRRGDGTFAYQLAVVVDDVTTQVTDVVRGRDLLTSAPRQAYLARLFGAAPPAFWHVPLVTDPDGSRLSKRLRGVTLRSLRDVGVAPSAVTGYLAHGLGITADDRPRTPRAILDACVSPLTFAQRPSWPLPQAWAALATGS